MTQLLPGKTTAPEFTKTQEKSTDFKHVSSTWVKKCLTYDQVMDQVHSAIRQREDITDKLATMKTDIENDKFGFRYKDGRFFVPTDHCLEKMGVHINVSTFFVKSLREDSEKFNRDGKDAETLKNVVDNALRRLDPNVVRKWRTYTDGTMRAWLSEKYAEIDNRWYLDIIKTVIPNGLFSHWRGDEDTFLGNVLIPDTIVQKPEYDSEYGALINVGNCEIGKRRLSSVPGVFRAICFNGNLWGLKEGDAVNKVHRGHIDLDVLKKRIVKNIIDQIPLANNNIQQLLDTQKMEIGSVPMSNMIVTLAKDNGLSKNETLSVLENFNLHENSHKNLFGIINSFTRASQSLSSERWYDMDLKAGLFSSFTQDKWERALTRGRSVTEEDLLKILA